MDTNLAGIWRPIRAELDGEAAPEMALAKMQMTLREGGYLVEFGGQAADQGRYTLTDTTEEHLVLLLHGVKGTNAGRVIPAIAQVRGDRLRVCYGLDRVLPIAFATRAGASRYLVTYRRESAL
jgi:uncharacterized protein (TIGR03067 family)